MYHSVTVINQDNASSARSGSGSSIYFKFCKPKHKIRGYQWESHRNTCVPWTGQVPDESVVQSQFPLRCTPTRVQFWPWRKGASPTVSEFPEQLEKSLSNDLRILSSVIFMDL